jgi:hypothetical protein
MATLAVKNFIRNRDFFKIISSIETGAEYGMWSYPRYRAWLDKRTNFNVAGRNTVAEEEETVTSLSTLPPATPKSGSTGRITEPASAIPAKSMSADPGRIEIEPTENFDKILKQPS